MKQTCYNLLLQMNFPVNAESLLTAAFGEMGKETGQEIYGRFCYNFFCEYSYGRREYERNDEREPVLRRQPGIP